MRAVRGEPGERSTPLLAPLHDASRPESPRARARPCIMYTYIQRSPIYRYTLYTGERARRRAGADVVHSAFNNRMLIDEIFFPFFEEKGKVTIQIINCIFYAPREEN